jgi:hypothetical protein
MEAGRSYFWRERDHFWDGARFWDGAVLASHIKVGQ